ncbi:hypothetical protein D0B54_12620 [Solimonas sp. K1W22B-7]|uniref:hypothetical protein n=1 Tax=Solimonas sp. K1W22B-7 TaxID=2303331 RepID=UPI000E33402C|nr:hypothetical protein [Solimonas sp. K1W22B-7]AXQ29482.1 hypothetical protein D0B54_12620 [Solimonas sp. K1W22B-7]
MSTEAPQQRLAETLDRPAAEFQAFAALQPAQLDLLAESILQTQQRQREALAKAIEDALGHIPMLLRGPVKKVLGIK